MFCVLVHADANACRDAYRTHEVRMEKAEIALVARVSGVLIQSLERDEYVDARDSINLFRTSRTVRLVATRKLKGNSSNLLELVISHCDGALNAVVGKEVTVFKIDGRWRLDQLPDSL